MLIVQLGTPLMLLGVPYYIVSRGLTPTFRRNVYFPIIKNRLLRAINKFLLHPLIALFLFECNFWFWHIPRFYNWALLNDFIHLLEHALMALTSFYLWRNIIDPYPLKCQLHMGFRLLFLAAMMALNTVLAAALTYANSVWYAYEGIPMPSWWAYRWDHLDDQRLGGLIMWIPGGLFMFLSMTICFFVWVHREKLAEEKIQRQRNLHESSRNNLAPV
jgi:putative membrane protein